MLWLLSVDFPKILHHVPAWWPSLLLTVGGCMALVALLTLQIRAFQVLQPVVIHQLASAFTPVPNSPLDPRPERLSRMILPVRNVSVPNNPNLLPGALRAYRAGIHEGVDFKCADGSPVCAALLGHVLAIQKDNDLPLEQRREILGYCRIVGGTPREILDVLHGQRVTLIHGLHGGRLVTTSYSHLGYVREDLVPGMEVDAGEVIAWTGNSGTSHSYVEDEWSELHFEVRIDGIPLGTRESPGEAEALYQLLFAGESQ